MQDLSAVTPPFLPVTVKDGFCPTPPHKIETKADFTRTGPVHLDSARERA
ncbi:unnamed protein product [Ciceribacter selenitireducens ATCC BAA-1503]|uniref:Uncharacterized protein n=1 Tax=Ciceribacter selenitireducens ATCC BAA-1503 TaxID=1336235 RepID=A0A376ABE0_9HYPH|nr:unnamed protein product [Ciceribacter selenitireducens ATCC BAA-1503]